MIGQIILFDHALQFVGEGPNDQLDLVFRAGKADAAKHHHESQNQSKSLLHTGFLLFFFCGFAALFLQRLHADKIT